MSDFYDIGALEGTRVRLEPLQLSHLDGLVEAAQEGRDRFALTTVPDGVEAMRAYVEGTIALRDHNEAVPFTTIDARTGRIVGSTRFCNFEHWLWPAAHRPRPAEIPDAVEIGYTWLAASAQRTGLNREAKLLMLQVAFDRWEAFRVTLKTDARNERSRTAIAGIGAKLDGVLRSGAAASDGGPRDSAIFSILASEWPEVRARLEESLRYIT